MFEGDGAGGGGGGGDPKPPATPPAGDPPKPEAKYTDEQVNAMIAKGKAEATAALLKEHGIESTGKLKEDLAALKTWQDSQKTEAQRLADANKETGEKLTAAEARAATAEARAEAMVQGIDPAKVDRAVKLIGTYDGATVSDKVKAFLEENPEFKGGTGTAPPPKVGPGKSQAPAADDAITAQLKSAMGLK